MEAPSKKMIGIKDLHFDFDQWNPDNPVESFYAFEAKIFQAWEQDEDFLETELLHAIFACNMQVQIDNGGIISFVDNGSGAFFDQTLEALKAMDIEKHYRILLAFQDLFPDKYVPQDMAERRDLMDVILENSGDSDEPFETWDNEIYDSRAYFLTKIIAYLKKHS